MKAEMKQQSAQRQADVYNPATGEVVRQVAFNSTADIDAIVQKAKQAQASWGEQSPAKRARGRGRKLDFVSSAGRRRIESATRG